MMRWTAVAVVVLSCAASGGCFLTGDVNGGYTFVDNAVRNLSEWPIWGASECATTVRDWQRAKEAWAAIQAACPGYAFSRDYACGFKAGYRDYLDAGGNGEPPAVPPFRYRLVGHQSPEGHAAIEDWYAGFRHGSEAARASGFRELNILPLSAPPINVLEDRAGHLPAGATPTGGPPPGAAPPLPVVPEELPLPRIITPPIPVGAPR